MKKLIVSALAVLSIMVFTGCSGKDDMMMDKQKSSKSM